METAMHGKAITKELTIGDILMEYPEIIPKLQEYGIHCIGCHVSAYEKIGDGLASHGFSDEQVEKIVGELNSIIEKSHTPVQQKEPVKRTIELTEIAANKLTELMQKQNKEKYGVRVSALPGGCSGHIYGMQFEKEEKEGDHVLEARGLKVFIDEQSMKVLGGTVIDYVDDLTQSGFKFDNPNAEKSCGCGKSFA